MWNQNLGLVIVGLILGGFLPHSPIHGTVTDRNDPMAMATVEVDSGLEAVFFLDSRNGDLTGTVFNSAKQPPVVGVTYRYNVLKDLEVTAANPKFLMVAGKFPLNSAGGVTQFAPSVIYVYEVDSGKTAMYGIPFNKDGLSRSAGANVALTMLWAGPFPYLKGFVR